MNRLNWLCIRLEEFVELNKATSPISFSWYERRTQVRCLLDREREERWSGGRIGVHPGRFGWGEYGSTARPVAKNRSWNGRRTSSQQSPQDHKVGLVLVGFRSRCRSRSRSRSRSVAGSGTFPSTLCRCLTWSQYKHRWRSTSFGSVWLHHHSTLMLHRSVPITVPCPNKLGTGGGSKSGGFRFEEKIPRPNASSGPWYSSRNLEAPSNTDSAPVFYLLSNSLLSKRSLTRENAILDNWGRSTDKCRHQTAKFLKKRAVYHQTENTPRGLMLATSPDSISHARVLVSCWNCRWYATARQKLELFRRLRPYQKRKGVLYVG